MSLDNFKNNSKVTVSLGYDAVATSIVLQAGDAAKLPTAPFNAEWWNSTDFPDPTDDPNKEIVRVTTVTSSNDTLTIARAAETSAFTHNTAGKVYKLIAGLTAKSLNTDIPATYTAYNATMTTSGGIAYVTGSGAITEDATNLFWDGTNVGIGTNTMAGKLHVVNTGSGAGVSIVGDGYSNLAQVLLRRANGSGGGPTALSSGDLIGRFGVQGYNSSAFTSRKAAIEMNAAENWGTASNGAYISIQTTPIGSTVIGEVVRITDAGRVGVGNSTPTAEMEVLSTDTSNPFRGVISSQFSAGAQAARFNMLKARGSKASPSTVLNADNIGNIGFVAYGTTSGVRSEIVATVNGTVSGDTVPTDLIFRTTPDTPANIAERMRITSGGLVGIGTATPGGQLHVVGGAATILADGTSNPQYRVLTTGTLQASVGCPTAAGQMIVDSGVNDLCIRGGLAQANNFLESVDGGASVRRMVRTVKTLSAVSTQTTTMFNLTVANNTIAMGNIYYCVEAIDTVNHNIAGETGIFSYGYANNNGTALATSLTSNKIQVNNIALILTTTWSIQGTSASSANITCAITFSNPTSVKVTATIENWGRQAIGPA